MFVIPELVFANVEWTKEDSVGTWNDDETAHTYRPDQLRVVNYFESEADIYKKYKQFAQGSANAEWFNTSKRDFSYTDVDGNTISVGDTATTPLTKLLWWTSTPRLET